LLAWQPGFDPSSAEYTYLLSCVGHPAIEGVAAGFKIRDQVWEKSKGRLYIDFRPLSQLGGEKDVISKLRMGAVQGMMSSSVAAANIAPRLGIVNLPYVVDTFAKLDQFRNTKALWQPFSTAAAEQGLLTADFTGYGSYGWATNKPVRNLADAAGVNFRIAEAPVNIDVYKAWGLKFTVMPWPDVPQALQTGVIDGLDHTPIVCNISKKFTIARYYTQLDYAQGLYIHLINQRWLDKLPADLRDILLQTIAEESAAARRLTEQQQMEQIAAAKADGIEFIELNEADRSLLIKQAEPIYSKWGKEIGVDYLKRVREEMRH
ncbi:MAG: TRAP transporter substrate-binding protein, partial [Desulfuromonadales bacterium]|nr:TRAP transporter substrate-binding protein [Desulfuromonadales bacterium]